MRAWARQARRWGALGLLLGTGCTIVPVERVASANRAAPWRGVVQTPALPRPDFVLTTTDGRPFDFRRETAGRTTLLFFGYTSCPDICPVHLANIAAVLKTLPPDDARGVDVVFATTDPKRDTPARIRAWLDQFDPRFIGLTGTAADVEAAQRAAGVPPAKGDTAAAEYAVAHAAQLIAYTRDDSAHVQYPFGVRQGDWAVDIPRLIRAWPASVEADEAYVIAPAPDVAALYFVLRHRGAGADTLLRVESAAAARMTVHVTEAGRMRDVGAVPVTDSVRFARGGSHVMLDGLRRPLVPGDTVEVELIFSRAGRRLLRVPVRPVIE